MKICEKKIKFFQCICLVGLNFFGMLLYMIMSFNPLNVPHFTYCPFLFNNFSPVGHAYTTCELFPSLLKCLNLASLFLNFLNFCGSHRNLQSIWFCYFPPIFITWKENLSFAACVFLRLLANSMILPNCTISNFEKLLAPKYSRCALECIFNNTFSKTPFKIWAFFKIVWILPKNYQIRKT